MPVPRGYLCVQGLCPSGDGICEFGVSRSQLEQLQRYGPTWKFFDARLVGEVLKSPAAIFEDPQREGFDEALCYCGISARRWKSPTTDMGEDLTDYLDGGKAAEFHARPQYSPDGDFLTFFFRDEDCYGERVDEVLTVYRSSERDELVGCKIKGVRRILAALGDFGVTVEDGTITLGMLFLAGMAASSGDRENKKQYELIGRRTRDIPLNPRELQLV